MSISLKDIDQISNLSRISFSDEEKTKLLGDLNNILSYIDQLNEVDVEGVEPLVSVLGDIPTVLRKDEVKPSSFLSTVGISPKTVLRKDEVKPSFTQKEALQNAPDANSDYFKVPKVIGGNEN